MDSQQILFINLLNKFKYGLDRTIIATTGVAAISAMFAMILICFSVGGRYLFGHQIYGTMEISELVLVLIIFIPLAYVEKKGEHLKISILHSRLSRRMKSAIDILSEVFTMLMFGALTYISLIGCIDSFQDHETSWGELGIALWIPKSLIVLGCFLMFLFTLTNTLIRIANRIGAES